jgi:hypothetical protein
MRPPEDLLDVDESYAMLARPWSHEYTACRGAGTATMTTEHFLSRSREHSSRQTSEGAMQHMPSPPAVPTVGGRQRRNVGSIPTHRRRVLRRRSRDGAVADQRPLHPVTPETPGA